MWSGHGHKANKKKWKGSKLYVCFDDVQGVCGVHNKLPKKRQWTTCNYLQCEDKDTLDVISNHFQGNLVPWVVCRNLDTISHLGCNCLHRCSARIQLHLGGWGDWFLGLHSPWSAMPHLWGAWRVLINMYIQINMDRTYHRTSLALFSSFALSFPHSWISSPLGEVEWPDGWPCNNGYFISQCTWEIEKKDTWVASVLWPLRRAPIYRAKILFAALKDEFKVVHTGTF